MSHGSQTDGKVTPWKLETHAQRKKRVMVVYRLETSCQQVTMTILYTE